MDGKSYLDEIELSRGECYERLPDADPLPTTSSPRIDTFVNLYRQLYAEDTSHIISIHISKTLSNIANLAKLTDEAVSEEGVRISVFDSGQLTLGWGLLVLEAAQAAEDGKTGEEILTMLEELSKRTYSFALLDTLDYLRRGGRISFLQHNVATLREIKPVLIMQAGDLKMVRVRTHKRAVQRMLKIVRGLGAVEKVALIHAHAAERLDRLRQVAGNLVTGIYCSSAVKSPLPSAHMSGPRPSGGCAS